MLILDEPTTGLHLADVAQLLELLDTLVEQGATVVCVEHHLAVMAHADHIIDIGPRAGSGGGQVVFSGTPAELAECADSVTGGYLKDFAGAA